MPLAALFALLVSPSGGRAQVIEIGDEGGAVTYSQPSVFTDAGARPIIQNTPTTTWRPTRGEVDAIFAEAAQANAVNVDLIRQVAWQESGWRANAVSPRDAVGVMQLTEATARDLGVDRYDLRQNIHGGAKYLRWMMDRYRGDVSLALAAYNAGPGAVDRYRGVPPYRETKTYVRAVLARLTQQARVGLPGSLAQP